MHLLVNKTCRYSDTKKSPLPSCALRNTVKPSSVRRTGRCGFDRQGPNQILVDSILSSILDEKDSLADGGGGDLDYLENLTVII